MRFADFLRVSVLLFGAAGTALAIVALAGAGGQDTLAPVIFALVWWVLAAIAGLWLGRRNVPTAQIGRLLANSRKTNTLPEIEPGAIVFNRLWPLAIVTVAAGAIGFVVPQVPAIAAGYAIAIALTWRNQSRAVAAIEDRDGVRFYFDKSPPFGAPKLIRTPGMRRMEPTGDEQTATDRA
ncbi:MAG: hypothetical protein WD993_08330 [Thermoleophilaceae bacterium]